MDMSHMMLSGQSSVFSLTGKEQSKFCDPMACIPNSVLSFEPTCPADKCSDGPMVDCILATNDGRVVMIDYRNTMLKVCQMKEPKKTMKYLKLQSTPVRMAMKPDGRLALTAGGKCIFLIDISGEGPPMVSRTLRTGKQYWGIATYKTLDQMVASSVKTSEDVASVDVLNDRGRLIKTVVNGERLINLVWPYYLCLFENCVWISDLASNIVFKVNMKNGQVAEAYSDDNLQGPDQVLTDSAGNCYIASTITNCVMVVTTSGYFRRLLKGHIHSGDPKRCCPRGLYLSDWGLMLVTWDGGNLEKGKGSIVTGYKLE